MPKKVLLSGASGFIGAHILSYFLEKTDWDITCIVSWRHKGDPRRISEDKNYKKNKDRVHIVTHDLQGTIPEIGHFDYILHVAAESHVDRSIKDPVPFIENNVAITLQMLEYARRHKPEVFLNFSTDEVYGSIEGKSEVDEWDTILPGNPYSASKACQEAISIAYYHTYGIPVIITNTNNIIGPNQDIEKFVPRIIKAVLADKEVTIHTNKGKLGSRFYNPVQNVSDALVYILKNLPPNMGKDRPDRYGIGGGKQLTNLEIAEAVAKALGKPLKYTLMDVSELRPGYDQHYAPIGRRLAEAGWQPIVSFEEGLQLVIDELKVPVAA